jgi:hypothetical protein
MARGWMLAGLAGLTTGCFPPIPEATTGTGDDTGTPPTDGGVCGGSDTTIPTSAATATSTTTPVAECPGGGLVSDLVPRVQVYDQAAAAPCGVCSAGDVDAWIRVTNPCAVEVTVEGACRVMGSELEGPSDGVSVTDCYLSTTSDPLTLAPGEEVVWATDTWYGLLPGAYTLSYDLGGGLGQAATAFCLE